MYLSDRMFVLPGSPTSTQTSTLHGLFNNNHKDFWKRIGYGSNLSMQTRH